ncbi:MAG: adenylate/guanylate cyclase domain-containing protein, partial [Armatimonadetes bacterium]|nr:adenylate/guanylate cyclase domain-containing protein [Armatimonadota bacterium]
GLALQDHRSPTRDLATTPLEAGRAYRSLGDSDSALRQFAVAADLAGMVGSRDLWEQALTTLREMDVMAAQQLMLKPYLPGRAVEELAGGDRAPRLAEATMMFVDMRGATALSGHLSPLELAKVVDAFLGPVTRILFRWQGTVDKFIGDCVVAVFGLGSESDTAGAAEAVEAGLEIIEYMEATRQIRRRAGASVLEASIGVNTGEVAAGCFGPLLRRDYTVLGYHVNLAQRLQGVAGTLPEALGTRMVLSGTTLARLEHPPEVEPVDLHGMALKGIDTGQLEAWLVQPAALR